MKVTFRTNEKSTPVMQNEYLLNKYKGNYSKLCNDALCEFAKNNAEVDEPKTPEIIGLPRIYRVRV